MWPWNKNTCNHQKLEEASNRSSTRTFRRNQACKTFFFLNIYFYLFLWLCWVLVVACKIFSCGMWTLSCGMWDLVPWPGNETGHWGCRVLATGPPGRSLQDSFQTSDLQNWNRTNSCCFKPLYFCNLLQKQEETNIPCICLSLWFNSTLS